MGETGMIEIHKINRENVAETWPHMREFLDAALQKFGMHERYPLDFVLRDLISGQSQSWLVLDDSKLVSAVVTETIEYPLGKVLNLFLMGGEDMNNWGDILHEAMVKYAREINARWIDTGSRRGIGKKFYDRLGYARKYENYTYEVASDE